MAIGIAVANSILLVSFAERFRHEGRPLFEAAQEGASSRLRAILMTAAAMIFGMLPMAIGVGQGGEFQAPMGRAVIGGIITSTLLTLVVVPVAYTYLDAWGKRALRYFKGEHAVSPSVPATSVE